MEKRIGCVGVFWLMAWLACQAWGARWYVNSQSSGDGDGHSWAGAWSSLQKVIDAADSGDEIWIAGGTYLPENVRDWEGMEPFASSFELKDGLALIGGFRGNEANPEQRRKREDAVYAWEFCDETVLSQLETGMGNVIRILPERLETGVLLDGLTVTGGKALGAGDDGMGGGLQGRGVITVRNCQFVNNGAIHGGGIHWDGRIYMESCLIADNDLMVEGQGGMGGGLFLTGEGYCLSGVVAVGNGMRGGVMDGGGMCLLGTGTAVNCTVSGNRAMRSGSGCWLGRGASLVNGIVWGNALGVQQLAAHHDSSVLYSAIEGESRAGSGNVRLQHDNAGTQGVHGNDNAPEVYYVCFEEPCKRRFTLGGGSYAIKRGWRRSSGRDACGRQYHGERLADIGACSTDRLGNLAVSLSVAQPCLYGSASEVFCHTGCGMAENCSARLHAAAIGADVERSADGQWRVRWLAAGTVDLRLDMMPDAEMQGVWNDVHLVAQVRVLPRPLVISADDVFLRSGEHSPPLTWSITGGQLVNKDAVDGALFCDYKGNGGRMMPIRQGTLHINDGRGGKNYRLRFYGGELFEEPEGE